MKVVQIKVIDGELKDNAHLIESVLANWNASGYHVHWAQFRPLFEGDPMDWYVVLTAMQPVTRQAKVEDATRDIIKLLTAFLATIVKLVGGNTLASGFLESLAKVIIENE